jgi:hypothetical protein
MSRKDRGMGSPRGRFILWPLIVSVLIPIMTLIIPDLAPHFLRNGPSLTSNTDLRSYDVAFLLLELALVLFSVVTAIIAAYRRKLNTLLACGFSAAISILMLSSFRLITETVQVSKTYFFPQKFSTCSNSAVRYSDIGALKICSTSTHGNSVLTIVFDSGSQIELPVARRSEIFSSFLRDHIGPLLSECDVYVQNLSDHFFLVRSDCG